MSKILVLARDVTVQECPWLDRDLKAGDTVWRYDGHTYGCVQPTGVAVSMKAAETPFFEVPRDAIRVDVRDLSGDDIRQEVGSTPR